MNFSHMLGAKLSSSRALYFMLPAFCILISSAILTWAYFAEQALHENEIDQIRVTADFTFNFYKERAIEAFQRIDRSTLAIKLAIEKDPIDAVPHIITDRHDLTDTPGVMLVALVDGKGMMTYCTRHCDHRSVADREYFVYHKKHKDEDIKINSPELSRTLGQWVIHVTRRVNDSQGNFAGVVLVALNIHHLVQEPPNKSIGAWGTYSITSSSGIVLAQRKQDEILFGSRASAPIKIDLKEYKAGISGLVIEDNGRPATLVSITSLGSFPLFLVASVNLEQALPYLDGQRLNRYQPAAVFILLVVAGTALIMLTYHKFHRRLEQAAKSELTYNAVISGAIDAFCTMTYVTDADPSKRDFILTDANKRMDDVVSAKGRPLVGRSLRDLLPHIATEGFFARCLTAMQTGESFGFNAGRKADAHSTMSFHYQVIPIDGGVALAVRDHTELSRAIIEHRQNRRFLQTMIDNLPALVHVVSLREGDHGNILLWNKTCETVTGYSANGVLNRSISHVLDSRTAAMIEQVVRDIQASPVTVEKKEHMIITRDGASRYMDSTYVPITDERGTLSCVLGISIDVTDTRKNRITAQTRTLIMQESGDLITTALFFDDLEGNCLFVNRAFTEITGIDYDTATSNAWMTHLLETDRENVEVAILRARMSGQTQTVRVRYVRAGGHIVDTYVCMHPITVDDKVRGCLGIVTPIPADVPQESSPAQLETASE